MHQHAPCPAPLPTSPTSPVAHAAPTGFVRSLLAALGEAIAALGAYWTFAYPHPGGQSGLAAVTLLLALFVLGGSLALAISGLAAALAWRRAGGRGGLSTLGMVLAALAIMAVVLAAFGLCLILWAAGQIS